MGQNTHFNEMTNKKHNQSMKTSKTTVFFKLNNADFPPLINSTISGPVSSVPASLTFTTASKSFSYKVGAISFKSLVKASHKTFPNATCFFPRNFSPKHLHNPYQLLVFDLTRNVPTKIKHHIILQICHVV